MNESTFDKLKEVIVEVAGVYDKDVTPDTRLYEDLGIYGDVHSSSDCIFFVHIRTPSDLD